MRNVEATQPNPVEAHYNLHQVMDNPPVYIEVQGSRTSAGSAENRHEGLNARNSNKSRHRSIGSNADLNDGEENAEKHEQSVKERKQSMATQHLEEQK